MRRSLIGLIAVALVAGCATTSNYEDLLKTWVGRSEDELVQTWGPPSSVYQAAGAKYLTYTKNQTCGSDNHYTCVCNTHFELASGRVESWRWDGNGCLAYPPELQQQTLPFPSGRG